MAKSRWPETPAARGRRSSIAFYDFNHDDQLVAIVAIGEKSHNRLQIGGEEVQL
jgi:hypothetical protein